MDKTQFRGYFLAMWTLLKSFDGYTMSDMNKGIRTNVS